MAFRDDIVEIIPSLRAFAVSLCGSRDKADDLVQEALTKAWAKQDGFQPGTHFRAWMFTILRNLFYSQHRKSRREVPDHDGLLSARLAVHPEQQGFIDLAEMNQALKFLSVEQREALILVTAEGLSYEQAAEICGCAVGTVKSRVNRARTRLVELLHVSAVSDYGPDRHFASIVANDLSASGQHKRSTFR
jgi:RNA polymerase sigma-70 factor (ECF subfamily)